MWAALGWGGLAAISLGTNGFAAGALLVMLTDR